MQIKITYKNIKNMILKVKPTLEVTLSVPRGVSQKEINYFLEKHQEWIEKRLQFFSTLTKTIQNFENGEDFYFLGQCYCLKVTQSENEGISLDGRNAELRVREINDFARKERLIKAWYHAQAKILFKSLLDTYCLKLRFPMIETLRIKTMKTRWGSCNPKKGYINLNLELIKKDKKGIEYVILHELAHLKHHYHDKNFYAFVEHYMPDWRERKALLRWQSQDLTPQK